MDADAVDPAALRRSLDFIERVNRWLGYTRATLGHLNRWYDRSIRGGALHVLDVATGSGDVPRAIVAWGRRRGIDVRVTAVDRQPLTLSIARERSVGFPEITLLRADALRLPLADESVDVAMCSMFLHHLDSPEATGALRELRRVSRGAVIAADLLRTRRALAWITLGTALAEPMVRHDARASVRQALTPDEVRALAGAAGLRAPTLHRHFGHRFVLVDE